MELVAPLEIGIVVEDLDRMTRFYCETLGLEYVSTFDVSPEKGAASSFCARGYRIVRLQVNTGERIKLVRPGTPPRVFDGCSGEVLERRGPAFLTFIIRDLDSTIRQLDRCGVRILTGAEKFEIRDGVYLAFAEDPEGNYLELVEYEDLRTYRQDLSRAVPDESP